MEKLLFVVINLMKEHGKVVSGEGANPDKGLRLASAEQVPSIRSC